MTHPTKTELSAACAMALAFIVATPTYAAAPGSPVPGRTSTPWVEELNCAQTGGPHALVYLDTIPIPVEGAVDGLVGDAKKLFWQIRHRESNWLVATDTTGHIDWSRTLPAASFRYRIRLVAHNIVVVPADRVASVDQVFISIYSPEGRIVARIPYPLATRFGKAVLKRTGFDGTTLVLEMEDGKRLGYDLLTGGHAEPPDSTLMSDDLVLRTTRDSGSTYLDPEWNAGRFYLISRPNRSWDSVRKRVIETDDAGRAQRTKRYTSHAYLANRLPFFNPQPHGPSGKGYPVLSHPSFQYPVDSIDQVLMMFLVENPKGLPWERFRIKEDLPEDRLLWALYGNDG